jgi:hypothetical protein
LEFSSHGNNFDCNSFSIVYKRRVRYKNGGVKFKKENLTHDVNKLEDEKKQFKIDSTRYADTIIQIKRSITVLQAEEKYFKKIIFQDTSNLKGINKQLALLAIQNDGIRKKLDSVKEVGRLYSVALEKLRVHLETIEPNFNFNKFMGSVFDTVSNFPGRYNHLQGAHP